MNELLDKHKACRTHCCIIHGCKYGHEDCPVVLGVVKQEYLCEACSWDPYEHSIDGGFTVAKEFADQQDERSWKLINKYFIQEQRKLKLNELKSKNKTKD